jgi:hypothetical protein
MTQVRKAKRKLSDIDFNTEGAHIAITHKSQGYSANGKPKALIMKARSQEFVQKVQQIQVTLDTPEFLRRFYDMWWDDAESLARLFGYVPEKKEPYDYWEDEEKYLAEKIEGYVVIKSLKDSDNIAKSIAELSEDDLLKVLESQSKIEPLMKAKEDTSRIGTEVSKDEVSTSVVKQAQKGKSGMTEKTKQEQKVEVEMIEKSAFEALQKSLEDQKVALEKATATIAKYEAEKREAVVKAKTAALEAVVDAAHLEIVAKAALALEDDKDFESLVAVFKAQKEALEKAKEGLFEEQGASGEGQEEIEESGVAKLIKAKYSK